MLKMKPQLVVVIGNFKSVTFP